MLNRAAIHHFCRREKLTGLFTALEILPLKSRREVAAIILEVLNNAIRHEK